MSPIDALDPGPEIPSIARVPLYGVTEEVAAAYWALVAEGLPSPMEVELREAEVELSDGSRSRTRTLIVRDQSGRPWALEPMWLPVAAVGRRLDLVAECAAAIDARDEPGMSAASRLPESVLSAYAELGRCPLPTAWPFLARDPANAQLVQRLFAMNVLPSTEDGMRAAWAADTWWCAEWSYLHGHDRLALRWVEVAARSGEPGDPDQVAAFVRDAERRVSRSVRGVSAPPPRGATSAAMVSALIDALDETRAQPYHGCFGPGECTMPDETRITAVVGFGAAALPALVECLETDRRLSRAYRDHQRGGWGMGDPQPRRWATVRELCLDAALRIAERIAPVRLPVEPSLSDDARFGVWALFFRGYVVAHPVAAAGPTGP